MRTERGDPDIAIDYFARAMRFSPLDLEMFRMQAGMARNVCYLVQANFA